MKLTMLCVLACVAVCSSAASVALASDPTDIVQLCSMLSSKHDDSKPKITPSELCERLIKLRNDVQDLDGDGEITYNDISLRYIEFIETEFEKHGVSKSEQELADIAALLAECAQQREMILGNQMVNVSFAPIPMDDHFQAISSTYPANHGNNISDWFPPNHMYTITTDWPTLPPGHNGLLSGNTHYINFSQFRWPPNHTNTVSINWGGSLPPNPHNLQLSEQWNHVPNHYTTASGTWPTPPDHDGVVSRTYPPGHTVDNSQTRTPSPHDVAISSQWNHIQATSVNGPGPVHGMAFSNLWPPNHVVAITPSWPGNHHGNQSSAWPPGHIQVCSNGWPPGWPQWPPNHFAAVSNEWGTPTPPSQWPLFPADHSWLTSATGIIEIIQAVPKSKK